MQLPDMESKVYSRLTPADGGCLLWPERSRKHGRGVVNVDGRTIEAVKLIWLDQRGPLPVGLVVRQTCEQLRCCNLDHVEWITRGALNSRSLSGTVTCKTAGHLRTPDTTYVSPQGRRTCRPCREAGKIRDRAKLYGITVDQLLAMEAESGGVCAICGRPPGPGSRLNVDHDHSTGQVRKLLCRPCNQGLGFFRDDPTLLDAAASYLRGPE
jgi:hypothetical protein